MLDNTVNTCQELCFDLYTVVHVTNFSVVLMVRGLLDFHYILIKVIIITIIMI